jgi:hypothetical protein
MREQLVGLLDLLAGRGVVSLPLRQVAGEFRGATDWRRYPWALATWVKGMF